MREEHTDLRIVKTRKALANALVDLLQVEPFQEIKISELCSKANVSRATFYNNYRSLDEVLHDYLDSLMQPIQEEVKRKESMEGLTFPEAYHLFIETALTDLNRDEDIISAILKNNRSADIYEALHSFLTEELLRLLTRFKNQITDVPLEVLAAYMAGGFSGILIHMIRNHKYTLEEKIKYIYRLTFEDYYRNIHR